MIRLTIPAIGDEEIAAAAEVLRSGYLVQGPRVAAFEQAIAQRVCVKHAIAVSSGTAALHLALLSLDIGTNDLVVTTAYSWPATANVIELCGAEPVFVDIAPDTFNIDADRLEATCEKLRNDTTTATRLRAILPVHAFGQPADMSAILAVADRYDVPVIEDAACALGAAWDGRPVGSMGRLGCFSFHPRKAITTGEGGMITTDDDSLADRVRSFRNHGLDPTATEPDFVLPGFNYRMSEIAGAVGLAQLEKLDQLVTTRRDRAAVYDRLLQETDIQPPQKPESAEPVYQSYVVRIPDLGYDEHRKIISNLRADGVEVTIGTYHVPLIRFYRDRYGYAKGDFPDADRVFRRAISLPLHQELSIADQQRVVSALSSKLSSLPTSDT